MSEKVNEFVGALLGKSESESKRVKEPLAMLLRSGSSMMWPHAFSGRLRASRVMQHE